jgi:lipopolysaccharide transport system ATP-binding protein
MSALIELGAGFHPDLTGRENIFLNGTIVGMKKSEIKRKFDEIVNFSGLSEFIDTPVKRYSSGMYARLGFSVAAHVDPDVMVVDEVLSVGDYTFQRKCLERMRSIIRSGATVIFVSHNLMAVGNLCSQSLLMDSGRVVKLGPTEEVIRCYMNGDMAGRTEVSEKGDIFISKVEIGDGKGDCAQFKSGQKAWIKVEVRAKRKCEELAVVLYFKDDCHYEICNISTQRMGQGTFSMNAGEIAEFTFELDLHFGSGTFHIGALIYRSSIQKVYDEWFPASTIFVSCDNDVRGIVNLYPKVRMQKINAL